MRAVRRGRRWAGRRTSERVRIHARARVTWGLVEGLVGIGQHWSRIGLIGRIGRVGRKGEDPGNDEVPRSRSIILCSLISVSVRSCPPVCESPCVVY